jgi:phage protein D
MPYGGPQVSFEIVGFDAGDEAWYVGNWSETRSMLADRLEGFTFSDHETKKDEATLTFRNEDFKLLDNPAFAKGQQFIVSWGWPGNMHPPRRMIVKKTERSNPMRVVLSCLLEKMDLAPRNRRLEGCTDSQFVKRIAEAWGFYGTAQDIEETTATHEVLVQTADYTDAQFCAKLAHDNGFIFYVDTTGIHWKSRRTNSTPKFTFTYRTEMEGAFVCPMLEEPRLEYQPPAAVAKVKNDQMDPNTGEITKESAEQDTSGQPSLGCEVEYGTLDEVATEILESTWEPWPPISESVSNRQARCTRLDNVGGGLATPEQAKAKAKGVYRRKAIGRYKLSFPVMGNPQLQPRCVGIVVGVADVVDGLYWIKSVETSIGKGEFRQVVSVSRDAPKQVNATKKTIISDQAEGAGQVMTSEWKTGNTLNDMASLINEITVPLEEKVGWEYGNDGSAKKVVKFVDPSGGTHGQREYSEEDFALLSRAEQEDAINSENQNDSAFASF